MNLLHKIFFPGVPYPAAIIVHFIIGGIIAALFGAIAFGYRGEGYALPVIGGLVGIVFGFVTHLTYKQTKR
ncbi:hypothetical protein [Rufibacter latericius]|uniref:Uncharacterized protein n=1 Tax=Rufibacter latericius TaxID=2487040 RepID=A0A3M9MM75_9BACT|nr:hypothetical protein [Rufibacter latericius]RNI26644.1 hypothetical protein EFB08_11540 [Rufibacter latericius]